MFLSFTSFVSAEFAMDIAIRYREWILEKELRDETKFWSDYDYNRGEDESLKIYDDLPKDNDEFWYLYQENRDITNKYNLEVPLDLEVEKVVNKTYITCTYSNSKDNFTFNIRDNQGFIDAAYDKHRKNNEFYIKQEDSNWKYVFVPDTWEYIRVSTCDFGPLYD